MRYIERIYRSFRYERPQACRLSIRKAKWFNDHDSPVMIMIDDFTNAWHSLSNGKKPDFGGDWGGMLGKEGSSFLFLKENLLDKYPHLKTVFFTVLGRIGPFIETAPFTFSESLDHSAKSIKFLKRLQFDCRFEIAYHGYHHGIPGKKNRTFVQEWESFSTLTEAVAQNNKGRELHKSILGRYPDGGKYGGWRYNDKADPSISKSGFIWWCRDWMPRDTDCAILDDSYELQYFGDKFVVAIPSTIHGHNWRKKQVDTLLRKRQIISVQEHIAKIKPGSRDQTPNIYDDIKELNDLFAYLNKMNVWYALGSEIAKYFIGYTNSIIYDLKKDSFKIEYNGRISNPIITLLVDCSCLCSNDMPFVEVTLPNGAVLAGQQYDYSEKDLVHKIHIPVKTGKYLLRPVSTGPPVLNGEMIGNKVVYDRKGLAGHVKLKPNPGRAQFFLYEREKDHFDYLKFDNNGSYELICIDSSQDQPLKSV